VTINERWVDNDGVRIRYLDSGETDPTDARPPVLLVPGFGESVDEFRWLLEALSPRRVVAVDVRGRGGSDAPAEGYSWDDHVGDIAAAVEAAGLDKVAAIGISRGCSYLLGYALRHEGVRGLFIGDYYARHVKLPETWPARALQDVIRGVPVSERMQAHSIEGIQRDAVEVPLWPRLGEIDAPIWVVRGTRPSRMVTDEIAAQWTEARPDVVLHTIEGAGHDLWSKGKETFLGVVADYLADVDARESAHGADAVNA